MEASVTGNEGLRMFVAARICVLVLERVCVCACVCMNERREGRVRWVGRLRRH